jgi:hypothetical protein
MKSKSEVTVTYRGVTGLEIRMSPRRCIEVCEASSLVEFRLTKAGKDIGQGFQVQVRLEI